MDLLLSQCEQEVNEPCKHGVTAAHILAKVTRHFAGQFLDGSLAGGED